MEETWLEVKVKLYLGKTHRCTREASLDKLGPSVKGKEKEISKQDHHNK